MGENKIIAGPALPNIPWENRTEGINDPVWRYSNNPIVKRNAISTSNSIFNSAVVSFNGGFAGVFRCEDKTRTSQLHVGFSADGIKWDINETPINFICEDDQIEKYTMGYDPRVCWIEDRYYLTWCNAYHGTPTIGVAYTFDFVDFYQMENAFLPYNRNGVLFPKKINGKYAMLSRPSDNGHTPFGDIFYSSSYDMIHWGCHRFTMGSGVTSWQGCKIGAGPNPIETKEGWLLFYHGVLNSCNGFTYSCGAALLDLEQPWKVKHRTKSYLLAPVELYECVGDVPNVVFPCAALADADTGRIAIYYGAADTVIGLAFAQTDELIHFIKNN